MRPIAALLEPLVCGDLEGPEARPAALHPLLNEHGGICDDLMVGRPQSDAEQGELYLVVNAGTKDGDFARIGGPRRRRR